ncbi:tetratricopeptide repeat protein [Snodgrassella alvi]|uniref:tetratricopeptide repeat protein n=1 Tax=Snodgrassella alvi TaxID=1196083 RepID=UPI0034E8E0BA
MADDKVNKQIVELSKISRDDGKEEYAKAQFKLGLIYAEKNHNYDKAEDHYSNIFREDAPNFYARAQLNLGCIYYEIKQDYEGAIRFYSNVAKEDSPEVYAGAQFNLGCIYYEIKQDYDGAIRFYSNVTRVDAPELYATAQFNLGCIYDEIKHDYEQAIRFYSNITKEDKPKIYASAQFSLAIIYEEKKQDYDKAELFYSSITREDDPKIYASAQFNLAIIYEEKKQDYDKAELFYSSITREDGPKTYAFAQFKLALIYEKKKQDYGKAKLFYSKITREDDPKTYAFAQFKLAFIYNKKKQDYDKAELLYSKITREDDPKIYAKAQINLAIIYEKKKQDYDKAELFYSSITREDDPKIYAIAQFKLAFIYEKIKQDYDKTERFYSNITREDDPKFYAFAQYNLALIYTKKKNGDDEAIKFFSNVSHEHDSEYYYLAQFKLGNIYLFKKQLPEESLKFYKQIKYRNLSAGNFISAQLILGLIDLKSNNIGNIKWKKIIIDSIEKICQLVKKIKDLLIVSFEKNLSSNEEIITKNPERRVAHYTRPGVLFNLLKGENPSKFRLNIVDFMNDPSENQVLTQWLNITTNPDNEIKTFLASFSFNHNSLNQFRLYGNEENIFGSGVSIAFNHNFFGQNAERSINMENFNITKQFSTSISENENQILSLDKTEDKPNTNLYPLPIYRCLYFDPKTEYISLAKRNKQSFYLEMCNEKETQNIENEWKNYIDTLNEQKKIQDIRIHLKKINVLMSKLLKNHELKKIPNLQQLLSLAVLPISCLIKHAAFEDEDECRMIYITHIADKNIVEPTDYQAANNLYIEYKEVEDYIDKIYLGPQCKMQHKLWLDNHFKKKHNGKEIRLIKSEMPLR